MLEIETKTGQLTLPLNTPSDPRAEIPFVSELTRRLRGHIENSFFDVWVRGEISTLRRPVSGHCYFTLKDSTAQISAILFRGAAAKLKFQIQEGMEILAHGAVTVYEARGQYQIVCDTVEPCGVGALQLAFEQLKTRLQKEGLFDPNAKKRLPYLPRHIGIVTSSTGAAVRDILKVLSRRFPNRHVTIFPTSVQGEKAAGEIESAIRAAEQWNTSNRFPIDVLIVGRGGGSLEDLWPFNEERVARAIFQCPIPIISAVGHEIDFTISDFVADVRAPTPSAAAEMVVPKKEELLYQVRTRGDQLRVFMKRRLEQLRLHLGHLGCRLQDPRERIRRLREQFQKSLESLSNRMRMRLHLSRRQLERHCAMLGSLSPLQILSRGYSVTRSEGGVILRSAKEARLLSRLHTQFSDGIVESTVDKSQS